MITISIPKVKNVVFECLNEANRRILAAELTDATTFRFWISGRCGECGVSLNGDDDESYRCPVGVPFTIGNIFSASIGEIGDLDERLSQDLEERELNGAIDPEYEILCELSESGEEPRFSSSDDFCKYLGQQATGWLKEWAFSEARGSWSPCWFESLETSVEASDIWRMEDRPLPPATNPEDATNPFKGIKVTGGLKVYVIGGSARKYASGHYVVDRKMRFSGLPLADTVPNPVPITIWSDWKRLGGLAYLDRCVFALRADHGAIEAAREFLGANVELLPANDGIADWLLVNVIDPVEVLDLKATKFYRIGEDSAGIDTAEFDPDLLGKLECPLFKVKDDSYGKLYFLERPGHESFPKFCERTGLTGVTWNLIWCEETSEIECLLETFVEEIEARIRRKTGSLEMENSYYYECIYGGQRDLWRMARFRSIFQEKGISEAIRQIQGLSDLGIPSVREICGNQWIYSNRPEIPGIDAILEESLQRRDPLLEIRGRLCVHLPSAIASLREMEQTDTGQLAAYGPVVTR